MALLQRLTGIVSEEQIMASLLRSHPRYLDSVKSMPAITGTTSDVFVRRAIMDTLQQGLEAAGILDDVNEEDDATAAEAGSKTGTNDDSFGRRGAKRGSLREARDAARMAAKQEEREIADTNTILCYMAERRRSDAELTC